MRLSPSQLQEVARGHAGSSREARQSRMLAAFEQGGITREDAVQHLDIPFPYTTVSQLRDLGHDIKTLFRWNGHDGSALYVIQEIGGAK